MDANPESQNIIFIPKIGDANYSNYVKNRTFNLDCNCMTEIGIECRFHWRERVGFNNDDIMGDTLLEMMKQRLHSCGWHKFFHPICKACIKINPQY